MNRYTKLSIHVSHVKHQQEYICWDYIHVPFGNVPLYWNSCFHYCHSHKDINNDNEDISVKTKL